MDDDWEDESLASNKPKATASTSTYVPNSWDDEDQSDEEVPAEKAVPSSVPMKPSKARALAMQERERKEMEAMKAKRAEREARLNEMSSMERKLEQQRIVEEADLDNAKDLFSIGDGVKEAQAETITIDSIRPESDADFTRLAEMIGEKCRQLNKNPKRTLRYMKFVKEVIRNITKDLNPDDAKEINQFTGLLSNDALNKFKKSKGYKKKTSKKPHAKVDRAGDMDDGQYDQYDEYDGFM